MFTGLVEDVGTVTAVEISGARGTITIATENLAPELEHGESVSVNGVCLTVVKAAPTEWVADVMRVTLETTALGALAAGDRVNLERAVRADQRLGGHIVQGHADGVATLLSRDSQPDWEDFVFEIPADLERYVVRKGSIALNGVSLTVAGLDGARVTVSLIPTTLADTNLGELQPGGAVNVEVDILAKYVEKAVASR